jgi:hypothetical protein
VGEYMMKDWTMRRIGDKEIELKQMIIKRTEAESKWIDDCILYRTPKEAKEETEHIIEESKLAETHKKINRIRKNEIWKKFFEIKRE